MKINKTIHNYEYKFGGKIYFNTSNVEMFDLIKSWFVIALSFTTVNIGFSLSKEYAKTFLISSLTVGIAFLMHELGHKVLAQKYKCFAEYRANNRMLIFALVSSLLGFVFIAPGAVMIFGNIDKNKYGHISLAGPAINIILAIIFLALSQFKIYPQITESGFIINIWLALFNMIPFGNFDGKKILNWNKIIYALTIIIPISLILLNMVITQQ